MRRAFRLCHTRWPNASPANTETLRTLPARPYFPGRYRRRHAEVTAEVPEVVSADVTIGSRKPLGSPLTGRSWGRRALGTQKVVVSQTPSADGAKPNAPRRNTLFFNCTRPVISVTFVPVSLYLSFELGFPRFGSRPEASWLHTVSP